MPVEVGQRRTVHLWLPHQHGAWAMLALPILVGIAASRFVPGQLLLAGAAVAGYLASATLQAWLRARRRPSYVLSIVAYGAATALLGIPLLVLEPRLLLVATVVVPAGVVTLAAARPGTPRELVLSLAHVAQASVLVPAAMLLAGETSTWVLGAATAIAAAEMAGSVLAVRSVIRERDKRDLRRPFGRIPRGDHEGSGRSMSGSQKRSHRSPSSPLLSSSHSPPPARDGRILPGKCRADARDAAVDLTGLPTEVVDESEADRRPPLTRGATCVGGRRSEAERVLIALLRTDQGAAKGSCRISQPPAGSPPRGRAGAAIARRS